MNGWSLPKKVSTLFNSSNDPHEVFTPRSHDINQRTYVERPKLESKLLDALGGQKYVIVHGESGNGKTWLYKKVLRQAEIRFETVNLANAASLGGLESLFEKKLGELGSSFTVVNKTEMEGGIRPGGIGVNFKETSEIKKFSTSFFSMLIQEISMTSPNQRGVLVLDNFEQIVDNQAVLREVAGLIITADDEDIAKHKVKVLLVGTPSNIKYMISKVSNAYTISNRLIEIPEVARLETNEAFLIMSQGFERHLKYSFLLNKAELYRDICWKTDRIAQEVQELCLKIALEARRNNGVITREIAAEAERSWALESLSSDLGTVEHVMNSRDTKVGRKNQVLYCLGQYAKEDFKYMDIEKAVRDRFEVSEQTNLNIPQILAGFTNASNPLLRRHPSGEGYRFVSPKLKMVIRAMFKLDSDNRVVKVF